MTYKPSSTERAIRRPGRLSTSLCASPCRIQGLKEVCGLSPAGGAQVVGLTVER